MAQLNRYSFAGYYFNQPNVKVRQVTKGSPPLRGSNFIAPGRTGEIWTPKKHGGRMLTLEILVIDEPRGTARMIFDQIQQLAATRTQSALVNYLDSGPRTAQAEIVNWTAQDIDNVGLVFVGQLDFYLADPWFYGATVSGSVMPSGSSLAFGLPVVNGSGNLRTSLTLSMTGIVSGQPILVVYSCQNTTTAVSTIADTFGGHYTWTRVDGDATAGGDVEIWIGTGGTGTSGVITVTPVGSCQCEGTAYPLTGASTSAALAAVAAHGASGYIGTGNASLSLTPTADYQGALYVASGGITGGQGGGPYGAPSAPWVSTLNGGPNWAMYSSTYLFPPNGVALTASWPVGAVAELVGAIIKTAGAGSTALSVTNPGTVLAEKLTLDLLGPIINPTITNATNGTSVTILATVAGTKHLIVDTLAMTALNDGANAIGSVIHTGAVPLLTLTPGVNALTISGSGITGSTLLTVSFAAPYE